MLEVADRVAMKRDLEIARDIQSWLPRTATTDSGIGDGVCDASCQHGRRRLRRFARTQVPTRRSFY
jgi:hypothetical protein